MADDPGNNGICPVKVRMPGLTSDNAFVLDLFEQSRFSAHQVDAKNKVVQYLSPVEVRAVFEMNGIPLEEREEIWRRLLILQEIANEKKPNRPTKGR